MSPQATLDHGRLPINAEVIEQKLQSIWREASLAVSSGQPPMKLCLANMVLIADAATRTDAERAAYQIAVARPSRVILTIFDEEATEHSAYVSTSCACDEETGETRCWEIIHLYVDETKGDETLSALRSLVVGSVPTVAIDFREYQTMPAFDRGVLELADYFFVEADVVPSGPLQRTYLPFEWYRTLPIRQVISELFRRVNIADGRTAPTEFLLPYQLFGPEHDLLLAWLLARLGLTESVRATDHALAVTFNSFPVRFTEFNPPEDYPVLLSIKFTNGKTADIVDASWSNWDEQQDKTPRYVAWSPGWLEVPEVRLTPLSRYVVETLQDDSEFAEYRAVWEVLRRIEGR